MSQVSVWKYILFICIAVAAVSFFQKDRLPPKELVVDLLYRDPVQTAVDISAWTVKHGGATWTIEPVYAYELYGLVASCHNTYDWTDFYRKSWKDDINMKDISTVWGQNIKSGIYQKMRFQSGSWTSYPGFKPGVRADWSQFDNASYGNNHLIPGHQSVTNVIKAMRVGDQIHIKGYLVNYASEAWRGNKRCSSQVRTDTGDGACEVIYVTQARILRRANAGWLLLYRLSMVAIALALWGFLKACYEDTRRRLKALQEHKWET